MDLITKDQYDKLTKNYTNGLKAIMQIPIVYLFTQNIQFQWLITEINPQTDQAYGLVDVNDNNPQLRNIDLSRIQNLRENGYTIYNSSVFCTEYPIAVFEAFAKEQGKIIASEEGLEDDFRRIKKRLGNIQ